MTEPPHDRAATRDAERRAQRRAFIRASHPDVGGDPDAFVAGLARFDGQAPAPSARDTRPRVRRSRRPDRVVRQKVRELHRKMTGKPPRNLQ